MNLEMGHPVFGARKRRGEGLATGNEKKGPRGAQALRQPSPAPEERRPSGPQRAKTQPTLLSDLSPPHGRAKTQPLRASDLEDESRETARRRCSQHKQESHGWLTRPSNVI